MFTIDGRRTPTMRLAISGTYSTGKSTTTEALSIATGIPRTHALTSRELLVDLAPGKTVMELNSTELLQLGLRRFEERVQNESGEHSFISDGSVIHEWVYGAARLKVGINPGANWALRAVKAAAGLGKKRPAREYMSVFGDVVKARAGWLYDAYIHLPVEFPLRPDGHRPVSEPFRKLSDDLLVETLKEIGIPYYIVGGTVKERVSRIVEIFDMDLAVPVDDAVDEAEKRVATATAILVEDDRFKAAQRKKSVAKQIAFAMRY
ncbi:ATP/GTP-binding protein [Rhodococcus koreensis]|uniref:AAA domain-containing protein n=1 Tax=Rhodococcus koreensis TaxID=99653 RepID=A0A1H4M432_9NOCA|nr:ATP-binding protein [Rhodococcus koreensis]SEB77255.1 AAA domain-containing protein [Rhodococcus koreensis]